MGNKLRRKYHLQKRIFLNRYLDMRAFAIAIVEDTRNVPNDDADNWKWSEIQLNLGDCQRFVTFDFNLSSKESRRNSLYKIRKIAEIINAFREAIEIEADSNEKRELQINKEAKQKTKENTKPKPKAKSASG